MPGSRRTATGVAGGLLGLVGLSTVAGVLITATVTPAIALSGAATSNAITMFDNMPSYLEIDELQQPLKIVYTNPDTGQPEELTRFFDQNRVPVTFDQVAPVMYDAILSSEDPRYYDHGGIDLLGTSRAMLSNLQGNETQGGSSISQQYVKNILIQNCESSAESAEEALACFDRATNSEVEEGGIERKLQEMRYAIALEQRYSKNTILLGYLNIANFGGQTYGVEAAANYNFNTTAANLTLGQAATLAGMVQNPNAYVIDEPEYADNGAANGVVEADNGSMSALRTLVDDGTITEEQYVAAADPYGMTKGRQLYVLERLLDDGKITRDQFVAAAIEPITPVITAPRTGCAASFAPYFCAYVVSVIQNDPAFGPTPEDRERTLRRSGYTVYTTLDPRMQNTAQATMSANTPTSLDGMNFGSSLTSVEAPTGRVLSIAQNTLYAGGPTDDRNYSNIVYAGDLRNGGSSGFLAGSTFKLFTLIDWLEKGHSLRETLNGVLRPIRRVANSCGADWVNTKNITIKNFSGGGYVGTPLQFTRDSLNTGYFAMAEKLDLCDIQKVATKMGVTVSNPDYTGPVIMDGLFSVIGSNAVSPIAMASAFGTVANNGIYCQPKVIDRITKPDGTDVAIPQRTCTQVIDPAVAATAAYALESVMNSGGTGVRGNPYDGTSILGKTGSAEDEQTWLVESSTRVATAAWVGNTTLDGATDYDPFRRYYNGDLVSNIRYTLARDAQSTADALYPAGDFPPPDSNLTRQVLTDLPNVVGQTPEQARATLEAAGFSVTVGAPIDSDVPAGIIAAQDPPAGKVAGGTTVTISPSNGQGATVPNVVGQEADLAAALLRAAGFNNIVAACTVDLVSGNNLVTAQDPGGGTASNRSTTVTLTFTARVCR